MLQPRLMACGKELLLLSDAGSSKMWVINRYHQKKAKSLGVKLSNTTLISGNRLFYVEAPAALGQVELFREKLELGPVKWGAHSYIRSGEIHHLSEVGRFCSIGRQVVLGQDRNNHPLDWVSTSHRLSTCHQSTPAPVKIGNDVWIGDGAVLLDGICIGDGAVIARNAVVTKSVGAYEIVAGNPARCIRKRFSDDVAKKLASSAWWEYPLEQLKKLDYRDPEVFLQTIGTLKKKAVYSIVEVGNGVVNASITESHPENG
ncbi:CatB-related O-acetyltransferase [Marinobacterium sp. AK62]|uniref:CatB-related O-acetyltransferase n=1 Tax=Marinobacterium alkalitolerans TaxID=1542925 RepID=A0ABS3Z670_9GAMM|nr:CatB-related O-acetyltransferase [Marinobacterium alkalitolerans]MBP0047195.1 CatB-related O-acetyltransferase [Marinobacterium alkalitolerans]